MNTTGTKYVIIGKDGKRSFPLTSNLLYDWARDGIVTPETEVITLDDGKSWRADNIPALSKIFTSQGLSIRTKTMPANQPIQQYHTPPAKSPSLFKKLFLVAGIPVAAACMIFAAFNIGKPIDGVAGGLNSKYSQQPGMIYNTVIATRDSSDYQLWQSSLGTRSIGGSPELRSQIDTPGDVNTRERLMQSGRVIPIKGVVKVQIITSGKDGFSKIRLLEGVDKNTTGYIPTVAILDEHGKPAPGTELYHSLGSHF